MRFWLPASVLVIWALMAVCGPMLPLEPNRIQLTHLLNTPSADFWLGNDDLGRSVAERLVVGARTSFLVSISVVTLSMMIGTLIGLLTAWTGGVLDHVLVRIIDVFLAFPGYSVGDRVVRHTRSGH